MDPITWADNKRHMAELWPRWKPTDAEANLVNSRWCNLHQDKLRACIDNNRLKRSRVPDIAAIHQEYCKVTGHGNPGQHQVERTRQYIQDIQGPTEAELEAWDHWAEHVMSTATQAEIDACSDRLGVNPEHPRLIATMVDYCRKNPVPVYSPVHPTKGNA